MLLAREQGASWALPRRVGLGVDLRTRAADTGVVPGSTRESWPGCPPTLRGSAKHPGQAHIRIFGTYRSLTRSSTSLSRGAHSHGRWSARLPAAWGVAHLLATSGVRDRVGADRVRLTLRLGLTGPLVRCALMRPCSIAPVRELGPWWGNRGGRVGAQGGVLGAQHGDLELLRASTHPGQAYVRIFGMDWPSSTRWWLRSWSAGRRRPPRLGSAVIRSAGGSRGGLGRCRLG